MKTEDEYRQTFLENCNLQPSEVDIIAKNYWIDLTAHLTSYFSHESREIITVTAAKKLAEKVRAGTPVDEAWKNVIRDFISNSYWNQPLQNRKPEVKKTEEQKIFWKLFKYVWAFFQAVIVIKIAVYYFGIEGAAHPDQTSPAWVWLFFGISVISLSAFAYRNRNDEN